jgi:hypothetical protein
MATFDFIVHVLQHPKWSVVNDEKTTLVLINKAVPGLRHLARAAASETYYELPPDKLTRAQIEHHILKSYEFDAIDISKIVSTFNQWEVEHAIH